MRMSWRRPDALRSRHVLALREPAMQRAARCPFCVSLLPQRSLVNRLLKLARGKEVCARCGKTFQRGLAEQIAQLYSRATREFEDRLATEMKLLSVCDRAEVLQQFGLRMENTKIASAEILMRALAQQLEPHFAAMARGIEGRYNIGRVQKGKCSWVDIDAVLEDGKHTRRRLRVARIDGNGYIQMDLDQPPEPTAKGQKSQHIAR